MQPDDYQYHLTIARDRLLVSRNYMEQFVPIRETHQEFLDRYVEFVSNIESALRLQSLLYRSVLFEDNRKTGSLPTLLREARKYRKELAKWASPMELRNASEKLNAHPRGR